MDVSFTLTDNATAYAASLMPRLSAVVRATTFEIEAHAKAAIQTGTKSGRVYTRIAKKGSRNSKGRFLKAGRRISHQASAPGEAPATDTGNLASSIQGSMDTPGGLSGTVNVGAEYGAILEPERPFMAPAAEAVKPGFDSATARVLGGE
ncbi:MAG: hypothetical protein H8F28_14450 [Fibrella sp.]|nr:hypothetical protein [Armatimonadota bacterium]